MADWTDAEVAAVLKDKEAPKAKKAAARNWTHATTLRCNASGNPIAGAELARIIEHTQGKAIQREAIVHFDAGKFDTSRLEPAQLDQLRNLLALCVSSPLDAPSIDTQDIVVTPLDK